MATRPGKEATKQEKDENIDQGFKDVREILAEIRSQLKTTLIKVDVLEEAVVERARDNAAEDEE